MPAKPTGNHNVGDPLETDKEFLKPFPFIRGTVKYVF